MHICAAYTEAPTLCRNILFVMRLKLQKFMKGESNAHAHCTSFNGTPVNVETYTHFHSVYIINTVLVNRTHVSPP